jgi:hypothetical protein
MKAVRHAVLPPFLSRLRVSPRERAMLALLGAVFGFYAALTCIEWAASAQESATLARVERASIERLATWQASPVFRRALAQEVDKVRRWSLTEPTVFIARVRAEADLRTMAEQAGVQNIRVYADRSSEPRPPVEPLSVTIEGDFDWRTFQTLLTRLAAAEPVAAPTAVAVEPPMSQWGMASVDAAAAAGRFRMTVSVPYLVAGALR